MTCHDVVEFLMDYLDNELPAEQRAAFEEHLRECPDCVAYLHTYQDAIRLGKAICQHGDDVVLADVPEELVEAILAARAVRRES